MHIKWFGQSAFLLQDGGSTIFIDPFGPTGELTSHGMRFDYPTISGVAAQLVLVTHEHFDHNAVEVIEGSPEIIRSVAGTFSTRLGTVVGIASEHDEAAGTIRGANKIYKFELGGLRICHLGDFGQSQLRPEQWRALGDVDLALIPVGGTATIDAGQAARIVAEMRPRWVVPMHYRTPALNWLEPLDNFLSAVRGEVVAIDGQSFETEKVRPDGGPVIVVLSPPLKSVPGRRGVRPSRSRS